MQNISSPLCDISGAAADRLQLTLETADIGTWNYDIAQDVITCSRRARTIFGLPPESGLRGDDLMQKVQPDEREWVQWVIQKVVHRSPQGRFDVEHLVLRPDGSERWVIAKGQVYFAGEGADRRPQCAVGIVVDVTVQVRAEQKLRELTSLQQQLAERTAIAEQRAAELARVNQLNHRQATILRAVLDSAGAGIVVANPQGELILFNAEAEKILGCQASISSPAKWSHEFRLYVPDGTTLFPSEDLPMARALRGEQVDAIEICVDNPSCGSRLTVSTSGRPIRNPSGDLLGAVIAFHDITKLKRIEADVRRLSTTDQLTDLANRRMFDKTLSAEIARARRYGHPLGLVFADLDYFKRINDAFGHAAGDGVLKSFADVARSQLRESDVAARIGGEEFALVMPQSDVAGTLACAERIRRALEQTAIQKVTWPVTASFGVAQLQEHDTPDTLKKRADEALYAAKEEGRNRVVSSRENALAS